MNIAVIIGEIAFISRYSIMQGIVDCAKKEGSNVILFTCEGFIFHYLQDYSEGEYNVFNLPALKKYDGVIVDLDSIENDRMQRTVLNMIESADIPCVSFNREIKGASRILFDNEEGFRALLEHLISDHKKKEFHYISGPFGNRDALQRLQIFRDKLAEHGLSCGEDSVFEGDFNFSSGATVAKAYLAGERKLPEVFVAANDFMAIGLMESLKAGGVRIPEDVIVTGYDNCEVASYTEPRLTTVDRGEYEAGVFAYEELLRKFNAKGSDCSRIQSPHIIYGKPIFAGSCGCCYRGKEISSSQSAVDLKIHMDNSLDILKGMTLGFNHMQKLSEFQHIFERYIKDIGMESFFFCQCGSRESYYEELELMAEGATLDRDDTVYPDTVWCPLAYEDGEWSTYPSFDRELLFPPSHHIENKGGYYIVMPVHQGRKCIGYSIIGNFKNKVSGRVLQHLVLGIDMAIGNIRNDNLMSTMLARINQKWQYDELTGLYNRSGFVNNANQMIEQAREEGRGIVVLFFDLDGLKAVNDQKGHEAGDRYIKAMADFLKGEVDLQDIVCRYGGDEYIVLSQKSSPEEGKAMMKLITSHLQPPLSASVGCEFGFVSGMDGLNRMIEAADKRMYVQKRAKKLNR